MRRIKFIRQVQLFCRLLNREEYTKNFKNFEPLIKKLPVSNLDKEVLKKEFNKFCQSEYGFSLEESKKLYSQIMSAKRKSYGIKSSIGLFRKRGFKVTSTKPFKGGSPGLGKKR